MQGSPKLRGDLKLVQAVEKGEPCVYLKDPRTHRFFRLGEVAHRAAALMDGTRAPVMLAGELSRQLGVELPVAPVEGLCEQFARLGFLENGPPPPPMGRLRGSLFAWRVVLWDPDRLLSRLAWLWKGLVSTPMAVALVALIAAGLVIQLGAPPVALGPISWSDAIIFYVVLVLSTAGHELAHAATLKRLGGEVHELGVLFLYFQPCLYCNVSDSYLLPRRSRLWVSAAGLIFELAVWGGATVAAWALEGSGALFRAAQLTMAAVGLKNLLLNLNPLLPLDGYYLLVDLLELPNLRQRAFAQLGGRLRALFGATPSPESRRTRAVLLGYALASVAFLLTMFAWLASGLVAAARERQLNWSTLVTAVFAATLLGGLVRRLFAAPRRPGAVSSTSAELSPQHVPP